MSFTSQNPNSSASPASPLSPMVSPSTLSPTWTGFVSDTREALILFEATLQNQLIRVTRRPHDRERSTVIRSGSVFIYEEGASGIKRWTDGVSWSPSRILNNFLIYRELQKPFAPGQKKRAKPKGRPPGSEEAELKCESSDPSMASPATPQSGVESPQVKSELSSDRDMTRSLVGSLTDSYAFKESGLVKKTMSVTVNGAHFHLVSYYKPEDVTANLLKKPMDTDLRYTKVRSDLVTRQNFRAPIDEGEEMVPASQYGVALPRTPYNAGPAFVPPDYMQYAQHAHGYYPSQMQYSMPAQQHQIQAYADARQGTQIQSPTTMICPTHGFPVPYVQQMPNVQMQAECGQYQKQYTEQQQRLSHEQQQRYFEQQRQQHSPQGRPQQQHQSPMNFGPAQYHQHQHHHHQPPQQTQPGNQRPQMQMPMGWPQNPIGPQG